MTQSASSESIEQVIEFLKLNFIAPDNIPEDTARRDQICMEARASILLDNAPLGELVRVFRRERSGNVLYLDLSEPLRFVTRRDGYYTIWKFQEYAVHSSWGKEDYLGQQGRWHLAGVPAGTVSVGSEKDNQTAHKLIEKTTDPAPSDFSKLYFNRPQLSAEIKSYFENQGSIFKLVTPFLPFKTPQEVCCFFNNAPRPFAPLKLSSDLLRFSSLISTECFEEDSDWSKRYKGMQESNAVHTHLLNSIVPRYLPPTFVNGCGRINYEGWLRFVFPFTNECGNPTMVVTKTYHDTFQTKRLIPFTLWAQTGSADTYWLSIPYPKQQPLYHLHLLTQAKDPWVILTDSIEIAELNQPKDPKFNIVFTSFICETGQYGQVNWSPLKKKQVYYLLTNHSGKTFEEACSEAYNLAEYLKEFQSIELQFIRMPVWYRPLPVLHDIQELLSAYKATKPLLYKEDIRILTPEEFETIRKTAEQRIGIPPEAWWKTVQEQKTSISFSSEEKLSTSDRFDYILWPLLIRGTSTMLYARKSLGKSALSHSIAACLSAVGKTRLFEENRWGASKGAWNSYKVLYLDFENGETGHNDLLKRVCNLYWRTEKVKQDEDSKNFIWKDMPKLGLAGINYALPENHQKILDMLDAASDEGEPEHPVDVLVIDTYHEFTQLQDQVNTHQGLRSLLRMLNERNIATLILNHPKPSDDSKMYGHGIILESFFYVMDLERKGRDSHSLAEPMEVHFKAVRSGWLATNQEPFKIYQPKSPGKWHLYSPERPATEERNRIRDYYINVEKLGKEETAKLLGTSPTSLYRPIKDED